MRRLFGPSLGIAAAMASAFGTGYFWSDFQKVAQGRPVNTLLGVKTTSASLSAEAVFRENYARILKDFPKQPDPKELKYAGMEGLLASLGDPHTNFFRPEFAKAFREETQANFFGVGARLGEDPKGAKLVSVFEDGPAFKAGLRALDVVTAVDGHIVKGEPTEAIVKRIKGPAGTMVKITVDRPSSPVPLTFTVKRARIITPTVETKFFPETGVGYLSVAMFSEPTAQQFDAGLEKLEKNPMKGLVIDMRGDPGGLLDVAAEMLSRFVENEVVVKMVLRRGENGKLVERVERTSSGMLHNFSYPIVVLINEDSASAAEIFSGCLRDYGKAKLIGAHTYGKNSVQNLFSLRDGASAKVTIAKYYLPKSADIGRKVDDDGQYVSGGLLPDIAVEPDFDREMEVGSPAKDAQLQRAVQEVLKGR